MPHYLKKPSLTLIAGAFKLHTDDIGHLPLQQQALARGGVDLVQLADNFMFFKWMSVK